MSRTYSFITHYALQCRDLHVVQGFTELIICALQVLQEEEQDHLLSITNNQFDMASSKLMYKWISELNNSSKFWMRFKRYYGVFKSWCLMGPQQRLFLLENKMISHLTKIIFDQSQPQYQNQAARFRLAPPKWEYLLEVVTLLLRQCHICEVPPHQCEYGPLTFEPYDQLFDPSKQPNVRFKDRMKEFYKRVINNQYDERNHTNICKIVEVMCWENQNFTDDVIQFIVDGVDRSPAEQVPPYMKLMYSIIGLQDTLYRHRFPKLHHPQNGILVFMNYYRNQHPKFSLVVLESVIQMMEDFDHYRESMKSIRNHWEWIDEWLQKQAPRYTAQRGGKSQIWDQYCALVEEMGFQLSSKVIEEDDDDGFYEEADEAESDNGSDQQMT